MPVVFPMHPRTSASFGKHGFTSTLANISDLKLSDPLDYVDFISLMSTAKVVVTDSGGVQEETTALSIPCITMRENTERPITLMEGTNRLVGNSVVKLAEALDSITNTTKKPPALWDGHAAERIISIIEAINEL
jgi:UDP-N-acetylglucosamine 2-epimerase (non-hydrolysing)